jgi:hypothetical protein
MEFLEMMLKNFNNSLNYACCYSGSTNSIVVSDSESLLELLIFVLLSGRKTSISGQ